MGGELGTQHNARSKAGVKGPGLVQQGGGGVYRSAHTVCQARETHCAGVDTGVDNRLGPG